MAQNPLPLGMGSMSMFVAVIWSWEAVGVL